ncbi:MAG: 50S ribosomal protein L24 [archaeon]|nr:50S ribosomal protein L24 [archaeon]
MTSSKARIQRKMRINAPVHVKRKMLSAHLSDNLSKQYGRRSARVCVGDTVLVSRGAEGIRGVEGKVVSVITNDGSVTIEGITINQEDGTAVARPIHASNLLITKLNLEDSWRKDALLKTKEVKK